MTPQPETTVEPEAPSYIFSARELARLAVYRAAVVAGFYTDDPRSPSAHFPVRQPLHTQAGSEQNRAHRKYRQNG